MTADQLFNWMRDRRVPPKGCSRCGLPIPEPIDDEKVAWWDVDERAVGKCCFDKAAYSATVDVNAIMARLHTLTHDCPAEGCQACMEQDA